VRFPGEYPVVLPIVRVLRSVFRYPSTFVDETEALCMHVLTSAGWKSAVGMLGIAVYVKALLLSVDARLEVRRSRSGGGYEGGVRAAMVAFRGMAGSRGRHVPAAQGVVADDAALFPDGR